MTECVCVCVCVQGSLDPLVQLCLSRFHHHTFINIVKMLPGMKSSAGGEKTTNKQTNRKTHTPLTHHRTLLLFRSEQAQAVDRNVVPRRDHREHRRGPAGSPAGGPRQRRPGALRR